MRNDNHRTPEDIQSDIDRTRREIDATLHAIEGRLTSRELIDQGLDYLRKSGAREFVSNLQGSVKQNPLPVSLVGVGLAWLMMADHQRGPVPPSQHDTGTSRDGEGVDRLRSSAASARESLSETADAARERAARVREGARAQWHRARSGYDSMLHERPLALGAVGLAVGALLAAFLPRTRQEDALMGEARDRLAERARDAGEEQLQKAGRVASAARQAAAEEAGRAEGESDERLRGSPREPVAPTV